MIFTPIFELSWGGMGSKQKRDDIDKMIKLELNNE